MQRGVLEYSEFKRLMREGKPLPVATTIEQSEAIAKASRIAPQTPQDGPEPVVYENMKLVSVTLRNPTRAKCERSRRPAVADAIFKLANGKTFSQSLAQFYVNDLTLQLAGHPEIVRDERNSNGNRQKDG
jgi:hypothetical protein